MINSMSIETAIAAAASFLVVAISHEVGHFLIAKLVGVPVIHLGVGFGPTLWKGRLWGETVIIVRTIPVGMSIGVPGRRAPDGSERRPAGHDIAVAAAGPTASYFLSLALFSAALVLPAESYWFTWCVATALFSSVVATINLVPIPGLDGGHLAVLAAASRGWQLSPRREIQLHRKGLQLMVALATVFLIVSGLNLLTT